LRVNDDGVDANHPDFSSHFDVASSCAGDYLPEDFSVDHGTAAASIAAASGNDGSCTVGIAPGVTLSSCKYISDNIDDNDLFYRQPGGKDIDVTNNSYGKDACDLKQEYWDDDGERQLQGNCPFSAENNPCQNVTCSGEDWGQAIETQECRSAVGSYCVENFSNDVTGCISYLDLFVDECNYQNDDNSHLIKSITEGRGGKGTIHVFSAGNEFEIGEVVNFESDLNSRFTITVGATESNGKHSKFSTSGVALFMSAPGSDIYTSAPGGSCRGGRYGTSWAAPVVAGVAALVLEANPNLGWRDMQGIFATTSRKTQPDDSSWITNAAGLHHSRLYGFGIVDANAAVNAAKSWTNYSPERMLSAESGIVDIVIPDYPAVEVSSAITISNPDGIIAENVVVFITLDHPSRGDLDITLTSPLGTKSLLVPGNHPEVGKADEWKLLTVRAWGEDPSGEWTLSFKDVSEGDYKICLDTQGWYEEASGLDCEDLEENGVCVDGEAGPFAATIGKPLTEFTSDADGISATEACCACGGGVAATDFPDLLKSWTLVVYGHDGESPLPPSPVPTPPEPIASLNPGGNFCFSIDTLVELSNGTSSPMKDLRLGDSVLVSENHYETIYAFGHFDASFAKVGFLRIHTNASSKKRGMLELTPNHLIFIKGNRHPIPASSLKVGDELVAISFEEERSIQEEAELVVVSIKPVWRRGAIAPFTASGRIVTNGIQSSCFATVQNGNSNNVSLGGTFPIPFLNYHQLGLIFESPHRLFCHIWFDACVRYDTYNEDGLSHWVEMPMKFYMWLLDQQIVYVSAPILLLVVGSWCIINVLELVIINLFSGLVPLVAFGFLSIVMISSIGKLFRGLFKNKGHFTAY